MVGMLALSAVDCGFISQAGKTKDCKAKHAVLRSKSWLAQNQDNVSKCNDMQGFQSGPVPGTFTRLRSCIVPAEITEPPKISGGQNHKYDGR